MPDECMNNIFEKWFCAFQIRVGCEQYLLDPLLVTDGGDSLYRRQVWVVVDRFEMLTTDFVHSKSHHHKLWFITKKVTNIMIMPPPYTNLHHHKATDITVTQLGYYWISFYEYQLRPRGRNFLYRNLKIVLGQLFIADMMFYTNRIANSAEDDAELGGSANWDKAAMNTAIEGMKNVFSLELPDEPKLLFCKPQSEAKLASIMMGLVTDEKGSPITPTEDHIAEKLTDLGNLLWDEECNVYLLESNVS